MIQVRRYTNRQEDMKKLTLLLVALSFNALAFEGVSDIAILDNEDSKSSEVESSDNATDSKKTKKEERLESKQVKQYKGNSGALTMTVYETQTGETAAPPKPDFQSTSMMNHRVKMSNDIQQMRKPASIRPQNNLRRPGMIKPAGLKGPMKFKR